MKKIKIYSKNWNRIVLPAFAILTSILLVLGIKMAHNSGSEFNPLFLELYFAFIIANYIIASVIRKPKLIITDYSVTINADEPWEVFFEEVDSFYLSHFKNQELICIRYKKDVEAGISDLEIENGRIFRIRYPENLHPGQPYDIYVTGLAKKPQEILEILNHSVAHAG